MAVLDRPRLLAAHGGACPGGLRDEYEARYRDLRRRLLAGWLLTCALAFGALVLCLAQAG